MTKRPNSMRHLDDAIRKVCGGSVDRYIETIDWVESNDIGCIFQAVGLPSPGKLPLMPLPHQIAQKLHALSSGGDRARDLVDLQLIMGSAPVDLQEAHRTCKRLFSYRKAQPWPPVIEKQPGWDTLYATQASGLPVKESVDEAVAWVNELVVQIDQAG